MRERARHLALPLLAALALAAPAPAADCGGPQRGMGGTGLADERGMGGTGLVGTVTGFGSVCVNGLAVRYDAATRVESAGAPVPAELLRVGHTVAVWAAGALDTLRAERIALAPAVSGPVTRAGDGSLEVMGQPVVLGDALRSAAPEALALGRRVDVHGLWDPQGRVIATRVEAAAPAAPASLAGPLRALPDALAIGGVRVEPGADPPSVGRFALALGRWDAQRGALVSASFAAWPDGLARASVETFVVARGAEARWHTPLLELDASGARVVGAPLAVGQRIWALGQLDERGVLLAERIDVEPAGGGAELPEPDDEALGVRDDERSEESDDEGPEESDDDGPDEIDDEEPEEIDDEGIEETEVLDHELEVEIELEDVEEEPAEE